MGEQVKACVSSASAPSMNRIACRLICTYSRRRSNPGWYYRPTGVFGYASLNLKLEARGQGGRGAKIDWGLEGNFLSAKISRRVGGKWYIGTDLRIIDMDQTFSLVPLSPGFAVQEETREVGVGLYTEYDNRDKPLNTFTGNIFEFDVLFNSESLGGDDTYQSVGLNYRSYHALAPSVVLAWELVGCARSQLTPLWDACRVDLRGFNATRYLGKTSASGQAEVRWRFYRKFGAVAFAGVGNYTNQFTDIVEQDLIQSYGVGLRYMLLESQRLNLRVDYARSNNSDAFYLSVGEAF